MAEIDVLHKYEFGEIVGRGDVQACISVYLCCHVLHRNLVACVAGNDCNIYVLPGIGNCGRGSCNGEREECDRQQGYYSVVVI